jgi:hypothetical protein
LCDEDWQKEEEITLEDMGSSSDQDIWLMEDTHLNEMIEDEGQKLIFVFDYLTERSFFMELKEMITGKSLKEPVCTMKVGNAPAQKVDLDDFESKLDLKAASMSEDMGIDFVGDSEFDEDEIAEGFDDLQFD